MTSLSIRKHAGTGAASDQPAVAEPAFGERARTLMYLGRIGSLSTLSRRQSGFPFGSVMPYSLDDHGRPIFLISTMAMHTQNLQADPRASLLVDEFLSRFLLHLLPKGFVRIRNVGFLANRRRSTLLPLCRQVLGVVPQPQIEPGVSAAKQPSPLWLCPKCGAPMIVVERFTAAQILLRSPPIPVTAAA